MCNVHPNSAVAVKIVLEELGERAAAVVHQLGAAAVLVAPQLLQHASLRCQMHTYPHFNAVAERHKGLVDAARLLEPVAAVVCACGALGAGQVHQRKLQSISVASCVLISRPG